MWLPMHMKYPPLMRPVSTICSTIRRIAADPLLPYIPFILCL